MIHKVVYLPKDVMKRLFLLVICYFTDYFDIWVLDLPQEYYNQYSVTLIEYIIFGIQHNIFNFKIH